MGTCRSDHRPTGVHAADAAPNVTAALHLGHAFNNTLQDILARHHRMRGYEVLWMPGTDHAGIATQTVVEKRLLAQGQHRTELGRDAFVNLVQQWKDEYEATITEQLQSLGKARLPRQRFTMDPICAKAVRLAFAKLFADDLIYRGKRLVNWIPSLRTRWPTMKSSPAKSTVIFGTSGIPSWTTKERPQESMSPWPLRVLRPCWETPPSR